MKKTHGKFLSVLLILSMALALLPTTALAAEPSVVAPSSHFDVKDENGKSASYTGQETVLDGGEQKVYLYPEGTVFSVKDSYELTEVRNFTTGQQVSAENSFTLPKDGGVYKISYSWTSYSRTYEYVSYVKCDTRIAVPGSKALLASQESTGTAKVLFAGSSSQAVEQEALLYPAGTVFSTVNGREIYDVDARTGETVAKKPASFTLPDDGSGYKIYISGSGWYSSSEFIYVKADSPNKFQPVKTYAPGTFTDVPESEWYAANVKSAYELDLVSGTSATTFSPKDNISVAATLTLAARIHSIYTTGQASFAQGDPWYQPYVDYAVENGIIQDGQFSDYNASISRRDFVGIMCHALPAVEFMAINKIEDNSIPDVEENSRYHDEIYTFYKAGVSAGNDEFGTFTPEAAIQRCAAAALVTRMVDPSLRIKDVKLKTVVRPTQVTMSADTLKVYTGDSESLTAKLNPSDSTVPVYWTSSNPAVATVSKNSTLEYGAWSSTRMNDTISVQGVAPGTAVITATCGGVSASTTVTVEQDSSPVGHPKMFGFMRNSVSGISLNWSGKNNSGKTVNYYTVYGTFLDNLGNPAKDEITGKTTFAIRNQGPVAPGKGLGFSRFGNPIGYVPWCNGIQIDQIKLEYSDGTTETIRYGWRTTHEYTDKY